MKKVIIFCFAATLFVSCKKDKQPNPPSQACKQDMAGISGTYRITAVTYKTTSTAAEQDYYNLYFPSACQRDDLFILNASGSFTISDAGTRCSPPGDATGTWNINGNVGNINNYSVIVQNFNCSALVIVWPDYFVFGDQVKLTFTRQ